MPNDLKKKYLWGLMIGTTHILGHCGVDEINDESMTQFIITEI